MIELLYLTHFKTFRHNVPMSQTINKMCSGVGTHCIHSINTE